ncbi:MAG: hypothetical protein HY234_08645 [Acidobacteria bacterium]|nr:hypothetical protein [Acidobacteriota bacterium]
MEQEQVNEMTAFGLFAGVVVVGFVFAKLRSRGNEKPSVTKLMPPKH